MDLHGSSTWIAKNNLDPFIPQGFNNDIPALHRLPQGFRGFLDGNQLIFCALFSSHDEEKP
jgi:hypothetical protein